MPGVIPAWSYVIKYICSHPIPFKHPAKSSIFLGTRFIPFPLRGRGRLLQKRGVKPPLKLPEENWAIISKSAKLPLAVYYEKIDQDNIWGYPGSSDDHASEVSRMLHLLPHLLRYAPKLHPGVASSAAG
jgi:hypothetical protein